MMVLLPREECEKEKSIRFQFIEKWMTNDDNGGTKMMKDDSNKFIKFCVHQVFEHLGLEHTSPRRSDSPLLYVSASRSTRAA